jgi:phage-related tail fiber protein
MAKLTIDMPLDFILTDAGKAAIVNANNTGVNPIAITKVGFGSAAWTPTSAATALQTEIKKLTATSGGVVAADTIHVTANDSTTDSYVVREIGLFTASNILVAIYSQADPIITKGAGTVALIAADLVIIGVPAGSITVGATSFDYPPATETIKGVAEIATDQEAIEGTDNERIMTPFRTAQRYIRKAGDIMTGMLTLAGLPTSALHAAPKSYVDSRTSGDNMPIGAVIPFSSSAVPDSWLFANGQAVSREEYAELFALLGSPVASGNGSTTFNVPDLRGEFIRGWDGGRGVDVGRTIRTAQGDTLQNITGTVANFARGGIGGNWHVNADAASGAFKATPIGYGMSTGGGGQATSYARTELDTSLVARTSNETRPRNIALMYCIKAKRNF